MQNGPIPAEPGSNSPNLKAVIFDYGMVLVRSPNAEEFGRMAKILNLSLEVFYPLWEASRDLYDRGDLTAEEYWLNLAKRANRSLNAAEIEYLRKVEVEIWSHPDPVMLAWVSQLHASGIKTGVLSNMPLDLANHVRTNCRWMETFDFKTLSAEVRLIKPDPAIYEYTLRGLGVSSAESLFVDDREKNIRAAQGLGIHALQFTSVADFKNDLEVLGFPILPVTGSSPVPTDGIKLQL
jgi:putative hydrolase of the HAD superfamily